MDAMRIKERHCGAVVVLDVAGPITGGKAPSMIEEAVGRHHGTGRVVVANLGDVPSMDLAGLSALAQAYRTMRQAGGALRLVGVTTRLKDLLGIARLTVFDTFDSVEDAAHVG